MERYTHVFAFDGEVQVKHISPFRGLRIASFGGEDAWRIARRIEKMARRDSNAEGLILQPHGWTYERWSAV